MQFIFFDMADNRLFTRDDAENATWETRNMQLTADFPFVADKEITRGMRVGFVDPDGTLQPFEIRKVKLYEPDHYQTITAEHIAIAELTDEFYQGSDATNQTAAAVLGTILTGTLWQVGTSTASNLSSVDIDKGTVWQNVRNIEQNWNVWITPRVTFNATGITGRYLDIAPAEGVWRGITLDVDSTMDEVGVTWDDSNTVTAVYGLGGSLTTASSNAGRDVPLDFGSVVWTATADHPAKPSGQTYIEDPTAKALYGRNGRNRFGYYQNSGIKNAELLLQKSWEYLKTVNAPTVTIDCILADLKRMGYAGQSIRLHDKVQVRIRPANKIIVLDVTDLDVDLLNPLTTRPTIGKYIPNIVYINRETNKRATGGGNRAGGEDEEEYTLKPFGTHRWYTEYLLQLDAYQRGIGPDGQISATLLDSWNGVRVTSDNVTILSAGIGAQLDENGQIITDSYGFPIFVNTNASNLYARITSNATGIHTIASGVSAGEFNDHTAYAKDTYVLHNNKLYRFTAAHASGPWTGNDVVEVTGLFSRIDQTSEAITAEVTRATGEESSLSGRIDVEAGRIGLVVTGTGQNATVNKGSIILAINGGTGHSEAYIEADSVIVAGSTIKIGDVIKKSSTGLSFVEASSIKGTAVEGTMLTFNSLYYAPGGTAAVEQVKPVMQFGTIIESGGQVTIPYKKLGDSTWTNLTFSKAVSLSGGWSGGTYSVSAVPGGGTISGTAPSTSPHITLEGNGGTNFSAKLYENSTDTGVTATYGYLHQSGSSVGVYTSYNSSTDTYSGIIASVTVSTVDTSQAELFNISTSSYTSSDGTTLPVTTDIGTTFAGIPDATWRSGYSFTVDASAVWAACYNSKVVNVPSTQTIAAGDSVSVSVKLKDSTGTLQTIASATYTAASTSHTPTSTSLGTFTVRADMDAAAAADYGSAVSIASLGTNGGSSYMLIRTACGGVKKYYFVH